MATSPLTIGLLWHSARSSNLGVGALTAAHVALIQQVAKSAGVDVRLEIIGWTERTQMPSVVPDVDVVDLRLVDFAPFVGKLYQTVRDCDLVLDISAGDSFTDIYGVHRYVTQIVSKLTVMIARTPLVLAPQTIGPFHRRLTQWPARFVMNRAKLVVTRDHPSTELAESLRVRTPIVESTDVAMRLPYEPPNATNDLPPKLRLGMNVSGLLMNGGYTGPNMFGLTFDYRAWTTALLERLVARPDVEVHLVAHVLPEGGSIEDDYAACSDLASRFPSVRLAPSFTSPSEAKTYIAGLDAFMGARMHACIAAFSSGVPVLPIAYSRKFSGLFGSLGYDHLVDCRQDTDDEATTKVFEFLDHVDQARDDLVESRAFADVALDRYQSALREILATLPPRRGSER